MSSRKTPSYSSAPAYGLQFPVKKVAKQLKKVKPSETAPVYLAAVLEYLTAEVLELAGDAAKKEWATSSKDRDCRITPRHIYQGVTEDEELNEMISSTGPSFIHRYMYDLPWLTDNKKEFEEHHNDGDQVLLLHETSNGLLRDWPCSFQDFQNFPDRALLTTIFAKTGIYFENIYEKNDNLEKLRENKSTVIAT